MGKKSKRLNSAKDSHIRQVVEQRLCRANGSADWIKQFKMQSRTMKVEQAYPVFPSLLTPSGYASQQPFFLSANGYTQYNESAVLVGEKLPQESLLDLTFKAFVYYEVMDIEIEYIPNRIQIAVSGDSSLSVFQQPTLANNIPQLDFVAPGMEPTATVSDIAANMLSMTARKGCKIHFGNDKVHLKMKMPSNLLQRQSQPMLRTNFSATGRDLYNNADLNNLVILPYIAQGLARSPYGVIRTSMTFKFAGRQNPDAPNMLEADLVAKDERYRKGRTHSVVYPAVANGAVENIVPAQAEGSVLQQPTVQQVAQYIAQSFPQQALVNQPRQDQPQQ